MATPQDASSAADGEMDSTLDAQMADVPRTEPEANSAPQAEDTPATDADRMVTETEEQAASTTSQLQSPAPNDEDTMMEDAVPGPTASEQAPAEGDSKKTEETSPAQASVLSPTRIQSPAKDATELTSGKTQAPSADASVLAADTDATKEEKTASSEELKKEE
jgi:histone deacetylase 1/2